MKNLNSISSIHKRLREHEFENWGEHPEDKAGMFIVKSNINQNEILRVIATSGGGWDHISVSLINRTPKWEEMDYIKRLFFEDNEVAFQLHVIPDKHINIHSNCLHLWRSHEKEIPLPPIDMV